MEGCVKVSLYSEVKEIVSDVQKFGKDNIEVKKIVDLLKIVSFLIVCATFIVPVSYTHLTLPTIA